MTHFHIIYLHNPQLKLFKEGYFKCVFSCNIFLLYFLLLYKYVNICYFLNYDGNIKSYKEYCIRTLKYHALLSTETCIPKHQYLQSFGILYIDTINAYCWWQCVDFICLFSFGVSWVHIVEILSQVCILQRT